MSNNFDNCSHAGAYMTTQGPVNHKHWHPNNKPQTSHLFRPPTSLLHPLALAYITKHMHYSEMSCHAPVYCDVLLGKQSQRMSHSEKTLQWHHNGHDSVSNHQPHDCLLNRWFRLRSKKTSKLRVTGLCVRNSPGTGEFPAQMASNAENVWWRHHAIMWYDDWDTIKIQWGVVIRWSIFSSR